MQEGLDCPYLRGNKDYNKSRSLLCRTIAKHTIDKISEVALIASRKTGIPKKEIVEILPFDIFSSKVRGNLDEDIIILKVATVMDSLRNHIVFDAMEFEGDDLSFRFSEFVPATLLVKYLFAGNPTKKEIGEMVENVSKNADKIVKIYKKMLNINVQNDIEPTFPKPKKIHTPLPVTELKKEYGVKGFLYEMDVTAKLILKTEKFNEACEAFVRERLKGYNATIVHTSDPILKEFIEISRMSRLDPKPNYSMRTIWSFAGELLIKKANYKLWRLFRKRYYGGHHLIICIPPNGKVVVSKEIAGHVIGKGGKLAKSLGIKVVVK